MIPHRRSHPKGSVTLDIIPSVSAIELFGPPDPNTLYTIRGILRITLTKPLTIKQITVKFKGFTQNDRFRFASIPATALGGRGARAADDIFLLIERAEKIIEDTPRTLPPGTTEIPFDLTFVADIPPSCVLSRGCIRYALSARVNPDSLLYLLSSGGIRTSVPITVRRNMLRNLALAPYAPTVRYRGRRPGRIEYEFEVPKIICLEQRKLEFSGKVSPLYDAARVKKILVRMDQMEVFRTASKDPRRPSFSRINDNPIIDITKPIQVEYDVDPDEPLTWEEPLAFEIPLTNMQMLHDLDTPIIDVTHKLRVRMSFVDPIAEKDMWLSFPVVISTIPGSDFQARFASDDITSLDTQQNTDLPPPPPLPLPHEDADTWMNALGDTELPSYESIMEEPRTPSSPMPVVPYPWGDSEDSPLYSLPSPETANRRYSSIPMASSVRREDRRLSGGLSPRTLLSISAPMTFLPTGREGPRQDALAAVFVQPF